MQPLKTLKGLLGDSKTKYHPMEILRAVPGYGDILVRKARPREPNGGLRYDQIQRIQKNRRRQSKPWKAQQ